MDLISREELKDYLEKNISFGGTEKKFRFYDMIDSLPSAFEGMTNGEVLRALFPNAEIEYWAEYSTYNIEFPNDNDVKHFSYSWWNLPYQKGGE